MSTLLEFKDVNFFYLSKNAEIHALKDLSFCVDNQSFTSIVGPSGSGKTTILSLIAGLLNKSSGQILLNGKEIEPKNSQIGYMFQRDHLFEWRNIWQNVTLGIELTKPKDADKKKQFARDLLKKYDLYDFISSKPRALSGGMRQRVALIRTLVMQPTLLLLDEPFSALDFQTRLKVCDDVYQIIKSEQKTAILVTHDISEAISMSDKVIVVSSRPATVKHVQMLNLNGETPLSRREDPTFGSYFDLIWKKLTNEKQKD